jgi:hypothetical protein
MIDDSRSLTVISQMLPPMDIKQRIRFLLSLAQELTITARDTYEMGSDGVQRPSDLRRYNEVLHRVVADLRDLMEHHREDVWCWDMVLEASRTLPPIITACRRVLERTRNSS